MAQRNPMNQRYQGDGPGGKTKKSAASVKPAVEAASSVHIRNKPTTPQEKRAAAKSREKEARRKAEERAQRAAEKAKAAAAEAGEAGEPTAANTKAKAVVAAAPENKSFFGKLFGPAPNMPDSPEYKRFRKRYWLLLLGGMIAIVISLVLQMSSLDIFYIPMGLAYAFIILAFYTDFRKVKPLIKAHQQQGSGASLSPKQVKHQQEAAERAAQIEAARQAQKAAKRKKLPFKKKDETIVPGEDAKDTSLVPGAEK